MDRRMVTLTFRDRNTTITIGMLEHILNCATNHLFDIKAMLVSKPIDFESPTARQEFENRLNDITTTRAAIHDALHVRDWLKDLKPTKSDTEST